MLSSSIDQQQAANLVVQKFGITRKEFLQLMKKQVSVESIMTKLSKYKNIRDSKIPMEFLPFIGFAKYGQNQQVSYSGRAHIIEIIQSFVA